MATTKVSALSALTSPDGSEELLVNDGGTSKKLLISNLPVGSLGANSVDSDQYVDGSIDNAHLADDAVGIAELSATGTASSSTFLRGDNSWVTPTDTNTTYSVGDGGLTTNDFTNADHTKLNGIEASATADQTAGEILTLLEDGIDSVHYKDASIDNEHLADDAVGIAELSATGTASSSNFLRGDNSWVTPTDTNTMGSGFTVSATTDTNATTITQGDDLMFTAGSGITCETTADGTVTISNVGYGKQTIWVPANAMTPTTSNGCAAIAAVETTAGRPDMYVLDFDKDADEHAQFTVAFPKSWNLGTVTYQVFWSGLAASTGVTWGLQGVGMGDNTTIDVVYGTAITVDDDAQGAVEELLVSAESGAVTIAGTPADNDLTYFRIFRDVSAGNDDMAGDARLHGVKIFFTTDTINDA